MSQDNQLKNSSLSLLSLPVALRSMYLVSDILTLAHTANSNVEAGLNLKTSTPKLRKLLSLFSPWSKTRHSLLPPEGNAYHESEADCWLVNRAHYGEWLASDFLNSDSVSRIVRDVSQTTGAVFAYEGREHQTTEREQTRVEGSAEAPRGIIPTKYK